jgi:hypothetical protein
MAGRVTRYLRNNVLGLVAIFLAVGAGAYAAGLPKDSIKSKQIKAGAVKNSDLADEAVTSPKVANGSLLSDDFAAGQLPRGERGAQGATGPQGPQGDQGVPGNPGTARAYGHVIAGDCAGGPPATCPLDRSKGVASVTSPQTGIYCIQVPGVDSRNTAMVASPDYYYSSAVEQSRARVFSYDLPTPTIYCPGLTSFAVITKLTGSVAVRNSADNGPEDVSDDVGTLNDDISFNFIVP